MLNQIIFFINLSYHQAHKIFNKNIKSIYYCRDNVNQQNTTQCKLMQIKATPTPPLTAVIEIAAKELEANVYILIVFQVNVKDRGMIL